MTAGDGAVEVSVELGEDRIGKPMAERLTAATVNP